jgi:uncharacterized membrane protein YgdD (TMEM256/DUF423 family)
MSHPLLFIAAINGFLSVCFGAFGAHGLETTLQPEQLETFRTGAQYHMYHSLAIFGSGLLATQNPKERLPRISGYLFLLGIFFFSGSLYILGLSGLRSLGAIAPIGGLFFLAGWSVICVFGLKPKTKKD